MEIPDKEIGGNVGLLDATGEDPPSLVREVKKGTLSQYLF
jgi:hypothetical protein